MPSWFSAPGSTICVVSSLIVCVTGRAVSKALTQEGSKLFVPFPNAFSFQDRTDPLVDVDVTNVKLAPEEGKDMSVVLSVDANHQLYVHPASSDAQKDAKLEPVAWANYKNTVTKNGWGYLSVKASNDVKFSDDLKSYAVGFLEGFTTVKQIKEFQHNAHALMVKDGSQALGNIRELFNKELLNIAKVSGMGPNSTTDKLKASNMSVFWQHTRYMTMQSWGIVDAYNRYAEKAHGTPMSMVDMMILNSDGETPELEKAYDFQEVLLRQSNREGPDDDKADDAFVQTGRSSRQKKAARQQGMQPDSPSSHLRGMRKLATGTNSRPAPPMDDKAWRKFRSKYGRCSALVRLAKDNSDIFVGHTTFSDYSEMNRIFKYYDLPLTGGASQRMGFASYPGVVGSTDDYYIMDTGVVVTETTVSMMSDEAFDNLDDNGTYVPDAMRIMVANRLAKTGGEWVDYMKSSATGTYNSQWMVVDYKQFEKGKPLKDGTLWVLEQAPGVSHAKDMSTLLQKVGFWASENRGYFDDIRNVSGEADAEESSGDIFSESANPRAHIFEKTAPLVQSLAEFRSEMQRNKWPHDIDGGIMNTPDHAIAARGDLATDSPDPNGGVDSKVTNSCLAKLLAADAIAGPTHDGLPPFRWSDAKGKPLFPDYPRDGLPDVWNFDWVRFTPDGELPGSPHDECGINIKM